MGRTVNPLSTTSVVRIHSCPLSLQVKFIQSSCGSSSVGRAIAFQAIGRGFEPRLPLACRKQRFSSRCSSVVEHFLGKEEVWGSIPHNGSTDFSTNEVENGASIPMKSGRSGVQFPITALPFFSTNEVENGASIWGSIPHNGSPFFLNQ